MNETIEEERKIKFYRYSILTHNSHKVDLWCEELNLHHETAKGYWIGYGFAVEGSIRSNSRWVSKTAKKRYAYPTKAEAMNNFIKRTSRRADILRNQLEMCELALKQYKNG